MSVAHLRPPWKRGQSGNPSGNNITPEVRAQLSEARRLCATHALEAVDVYLRLMRSGSEAAKIKAAGEILDRAGLKAIALDVESVETDPQGGEKVVRVRFVDDPNAGN